jgi:alpha-L-fucosidase
MKKALLSLLPVVLAFLLVGMPRSAAAAPGEDPRLQWFLDDRFGMFIHWGVYSGPAGEWKGRESSAYAEWLMEDLRIPVAEYESEIAAKFNPVDFDAEEWVRLAKRAGMRYIVITTKHHDGFAMFHSKVSPYNIVDATPFDRDPIKELAEACAAAGIRLCFYYSHAKDWHHPGGEGNHWEHPDASLEDFAGYLDEKVFPQVEELLTRYGPVGLMWFDTPKKINPGQSRALVEHVRSLQPDCLVNSRVAHIRPHIGDYLEMGDNSLPAPGERFDGAWETSATMNHSYGYHKNDADWKSATRMIHNLIQVVSKGGNYLLNVGPTGRGVIPEPSVERLEEIGAWMDVNSEAIYNTRPWFITQENENILFTGTPDRRVLYALCLEWPGDKLTLESVRAREGSAIRMLGWDEPLEWEQNDDALSIALPQPLQDPARRPCKHAWVFKIEALPPHDEAPAFDLADSAPAPRLAPADDQPAKTDEAPRQQDAPAPGQDMAIDLGGGVKIEFVWIPALKGWAGKYEVTNGEYRRFKPSHDSRSFEGHSLNHDRQPAVHVSWNDAQAFIRWMKANSALPEGYALTLPSGSEWTTVAQCGDGRPWPWGNGFPPPTGQAGNYHGKEGAGSWSRINKYQDDFPVTAQVEKLWRNPWGLHGVGGNVWEWTEEEEEAGRSYMTRGASWNNSHFSNLPCDFRNGFHASIRQNFIGFRLFLRPEANAP